MIHKCTSSGCFVQRRYVTNFLMTGIQMFHVRRNFMELVTLLDDT